MGRKKKTPDEQVPPQQDRHKPSRMTRVRERIAQALDILIERRESDFTTEVNRALIEVLEREGLWPPPPSPKP